MPANTVPLTYNLYVTQIATMAVVETTTVSSVVVGVDQAFNDILPQMINYAELRIQRDLDLLPALATRTYSLTNGTNAIAIPTDDFVTLETVQLVTPVTLSLAPLLPVSKEFIQNLYRNPATTGVPRFFAMVGGDLATGGTTSNNVLFGPYANATYAVSVRGVQRVPSLAKNNSNPAAGTATTFISTYLPDMLIMASMVYISAFQRNFGRMSDDPSMAQSYEGQYQVLLRAAIAEEYRKKFAASAWSSSSQPTVASPTR